MATANQDHDGAPARGMTEGQRAGVRKTVTIIVLFVLAVFAWTIVGRLIH